MTFQRAHGAPDHLAHPVARPGVAHRRRRLRSEPGAGRLDRIPTLASTSSSAAKASVTFRELLRALERRDAAVGGRRALVSRDGAASVAIRRGRLRRSRTATIKPPNRAARVLSGYTMLGRQVDVVETSRGCTFDCSFCSIIEMRGRNFHRFPIARVHRRHRATPAARGARAIFFVDDNITLDVPRFEALCQAIIDAGLNDVDYIVQGMTAPIAAHGDDAGAADEAGRLPLRVPRHRERPRRRSRVPEGARQEQPARATAGPAQRDARRDRRPAPPRHARRRRPDRRQSRRHARVDRGEPRRSRAGTSTGRTSSIRRRIRARR